MSNVQDTAKADATKARNFLHAFGAARPFTFAVIAILAGGVLEHFLRF